MSSDDWVCIKCGRIVPEADPCPCAAPPASPAAERCFVCGRPATRYSANEFMCEDRWNGVTCALESALRRAAPAERCPTCKEDDDRDLDRPECWHGNAAAVSRDDVSSYLREVWAHDTTLPEPSDEMIDGVWSLLRHPATTPMLLAVQAWERGQSYSRLLATGCPVNASHAAAPAPSATAAREAAPIETQRITPTCRANHSELGAWEIATSRLFEVYTAQAKRHPDATFNLSITRALAQRGGASGAA